MRIEKVIIQNINSLAGRFEVDFTDRGYSSGLFAIVGPSGAGKTTVLDAICLALYGQTPRIGQISVTQDELMTKGMSFCSAEVVFVSRGKRYKAVFSHKRSGGKDPFRAVEREIIEYTDDGCKTIASSIRETDTKITEITGLDFGRFSRSIMLAQFQFSKFLYSDQTERAKILEQVSDMDIYRRISAAVFERARGEEAALQQIRMKSGLIAMPDEAQETAYARELERLEASLPKQVQVREALRKCLDGLFRIGKHNEALTQYATETPALQKALADGEMKLAAAQQEEQRTDEELKVLRKTLVTVRALDIQVGAEKKECARIDKAAKEQDDAIRENKKRILELFKRYAPEAKPEELKAMYEADDVSVLMRAGVQADIDAAAKKQQGVKAEIAALLDGRDEPYWRACIETLRVETALAEAREAHAKAKAEQTEEANRQSGFAAQHQAAKVSAAEIEQKYEYALLEEKFGEERRKLTAGEPCPLCGATEHPYAANEHPQSYLNAVEAQRKESDSELRRIERAMAESGQRLIDIIKRIGELEKNIKQYEEALGKQAEKTPEAARAALEDAEKRMRAYPALLNKLSEAAAEAVALTVRLGDVEKDVQAVALRKQQITEAEQQADKLKKELAQAQTACDEHVKQRITLFGSKDADTEQNATEKAYQTAQREKEQRRTIKEQASNALEQNGRDLSRTQAVLEKEQAALTTDYETALAQMRQLEVPGEEDALAAFEQTAAALGEKPEKTPLSAAAQALEKSISGGTERKALIAQRLKEIAQNRKALQELKHAEREQKQRVEKWGRLNVFIGSSSGDKFSRMAQGITFDALLRYANAGLSRMTDRYILVRETAGGAKPLELAVVDTYQAGEKRPVSNLSGGESFLVSLALALGLSEMSSGRARIDSLFIDEGFASLDDDYLEAALQTLSTLSTREGKLVGVISHVEALKERIDTQIEVRKRSGGRSTLSGPGITAGEA